MTHAMMTDAASALQFALGGRSNMTLVSKKTGVRFTFRVKQPKDRADKVRFVSVREGASQTYMGYFYQDGLQMRSSAKSRKTPESVEWKAFQWALSALAAGVMPSTLEFWHEGKCGCCGRPLTDPVSISRGIGPDCYARYVEGRRAAA